MRQVLKVGVVGTSSIMREMLEAIRQTEGLLAQVVYSRSLERGKAFATQNGVPEACDDYEGMISREDLDVIYPEFLTELENVGIYAIIEEKQRQFDTWLAEQEGTDASDY